MRKKENQSLKGEQLSFFPKIGDNYISQKLLIKGRDRKPGSKQINVIPQISCHRGRIRESQGIHEIWHYIYFTHLHRAIYIFPGNILWNTVQYFITFWAQHNALGIICFKWAIMLFAGTSQKNKKNRWQQWNNFDNQCGSKHSCMLSNHEFKSWTFIQAFYQLG